MPARATPVSSRQAAALASLLALFAPAGCSGATGTEGAAAQDDPSAAPAPAREDLATLERRRDALRHDRLESRGHRDTHNLALDEAVTDLPAASSTEAGSSPVFAIDGDPSTSWRGASGAGAWTYALPFRRVVHLGLLRAVFGDSSSAGVPSHFRWEYRAPVEGRCEPWALWQTLPGGERDDRDANTFLNGPKEVHAERQALFADTDACALRLSVLSTEGPGGPVLRELRLLESARSITREPGVTVEASSRAPALMPSSPAAVVDGTYEGLWAGGADGGPWVVTIRLPRVRTIDRALLVLGYDAVTVPYQDRPGRRYAGGYLPLRYTLATSHDDDLSHLVTVKEASPPRAGAELLPARRRLVHLGSPRPVKVIRLTIHEATGPWGEHDPVLAAPVVREIALFDEGDARPVVNEPLFLSVDANPSGLTDALKGGEAFADGLFARDAYHRLRRIVGGFDAESRWPADASRKRDASTGRFLEVIEGDDPLLAAPLLEAMAPPPVVMLSGSFDWEFDRKTAPSPSRRGHWGWDVTAPASGTDRGMGQLRAAVQDRVAPFLGFCGGAQILALLEAQSSWPVRTASRPDDDEQQLLLDAVIARNENHPVRGLTTHKNPYERAWWTDLPATDAERPVIRFDPSDPLFDVDGDAHRSTTREIPTSHGDMIRPTPFGDRLARLRIAAYSDFCRPWVSADGPEPTWPDPSDPRNRCVRLVQAFRSYDPTRFPVVGFQFHPEQRDLTRLAPGSLPASRGDALNVFANAVDLALEGYLRAYWPGA